MAVKQDERFSRAYNAWRVGDHADAEQHVRSYLEKNPDSDEAYLLLGNILVRIGRVADAATAFRKSIETNPENLEALNGLGVVCRLLGRTDEAVAAFQAALQIDPDDGTIHYNLGNVFKQTGDLGAAEQAYRGAVERQPDLSVAWNNLGTMIQGRGDVAEAVALFRRGLMHDPNHPGLHYNLGVACELLDESDEATVAYRRALQSRPGWVDALNNLAVLQQKSGDLTAAANNMREALKIDGNNAVAHNNLATIEAQLGRSDEARRHYQVALQIDPGYIRAVRNLAQLLRVNPGLPDTVEELTTLVQVNPDDAELRFVLSDVCMGLDRLNEAETQLTEVLGILPGNAEALRLLGAVYFRQGKRDSAEECFARIQELEPDNDRFRVDEARLFYDVGKYEVALDRIDGFLVGHPEHRDALLLKSEILLALDRGEASLEVLKQMRSLFSDDGRVISLIARAQQRLGSSEEALETADQLISLQGNRGSAEDLAALNESLEIYESAVDGLRSELWEENLRRLGGLIDQATTDASTRETGTLQVDEVGEFDAESIPILGSWGQEFFAEEEEKLLRLSDLQEELDEPVRADAAERSLLDLSGVESQGFRRPAEHDEEEYHHRIIHKTTEEIVEPSSRPESSPPDTTPASATVSPAGSPFAQASAGGSGGSGGNPGAGRSDASGGDDIQYPRYDTPFSVPVGENPGPDDQPPVPESTPDSVGNRRDRTGDPSPGAAQFAPPPWIVSSATAPVFGGPSFDSDADIDFSDVIRDQSEAGEESSFDHPGLSQLLKAAESLQAIVNGDSGASDTEATDTKASEPDVEEPEVVAQHSPQTSGARFPGSTPRRHVTDQMPAAEPRDEKPVDPRINLLDHLVNLAGSLPEQKQAEFLESEMRLKIESLRNRLIGRRGLKRDLGRFAPIHDSEADTRITTKRVAEAMKFMQSISGYLPDPSISNVLNRRLDGIVRKLQDLRTARK